MSAASEQNFQAPPPPPMPEKPRARRPAKLLSIGIGFIVVGGIVVVLGITKFLAGGVTTGAAICFFGVLLAAFSFIPLPAVSGGEETLSFLDKVTGVFYEPSRVFRSLRFHPHWAGAFAILCVLTAIYSFAFVQRITPERIVEHTTQKLAEMGPPFAPPPDALEAMKTQQLQALKNPAEVIGGAVKRFVSFFVVSCIVAGLSLLGILAFGGRMNFWQALAVTFYSALPVMAIQKLLGLVILYLKSPDDLHPILNQETTLQDNLGILFAPADHPVLFVIASFIGLTSKLRSASRASPATGRKARNRRPPRAQSRVTTTISTGGDLSRRCADHGELEVRCSTHRLMEDAPMQDEDATLERLVDSPLTLADNERDLRHYDVYDVDGQNVGSVHALYVDRRERRVRFLEVKGGGVLGIGDRSILVPIDAVERYDEQGVYLGHPGSRLAQAPAYDPELVEDRGYWESLYGWYGYTPYWAPTGVAGYRAR
jgi:sporulation protein YlmC with PRC-barrel domain